MTKTNIPNRTRLGAFVPHKQGTNKKEKKKMIRRKEEKKERKKEKKRRKERKEEKRKERKFMSSKVPNTTLKWSYPNKKFNSQP